MSLRHNWSRHIRYGIMAGLLAIVLLPQVKLPAQADVARVDVWWPKSGSVINGVQPFKATVVGQEVSEYRMTWSVDGGREIAMYDSNQDYPHKEALVDVSGWGWSTNGTYTITYRAYGLDGNVISEQTSQFSQKTSVQASAPQVTDATPSPVAAAVPVTTPKAVAAKQPAVVTTKLYVDPENPAAKAAAALRSNGQNDSAMLLDKLGKSSTAKWFGGWNADVRSDVDALVTKAAAANQTPVLVAYNIPNRDCGSYSAGGAPAGAYSQWIRAFSAGLEGRNAIVIVEPDALAQNTCLSSGDKAERYKLLTEAVASIKSASPNAKVYLDAGNSRWVSAIDMASRLKQSGIDQADGFALNVSNFIPTIEAQAYGHLVSAATGGKHFVVDTSRNGQGAASGNEWCNPSGRGLGLQPTTATNDPIADAFLWLKAPGESDGSCNGGPSAGVWWTDYALGLAKRAIY